MERIERIIEALRQQAQDNPLVRSTIELIVAIGEQILQPVQGSTGDTEGVRDSSSPSTPEQQTHFPSLSQEESAMRSAPWAMERDGEEQLLRPDDLERLIEHFRSGKAYEVAAQIPSAMESSLTSRAGAELFGERGMPETEPLYDPDVVTTRARLKAEVARWCADRLRGEVPYEAEVRYYRSAVQRAKALPHCYLWMLEYRGPTTLLEYVADCYEAAADIAELLPLIPKARRRPSWAERLLDTAATVQSALHNVLREAGLDVRRYPDPDQEAIFSWLKWYTRTYQKFIPRHMELRDPADFTRIGRVIEELDQLRGDIPLLQQQGEPNIQEGMSTQLPASLEIKKHLRTLRYHVGHILRHSIEPDHHWRRIREEIEAIIELGLAPSNTELRSALLPIIEDIPTSDDYVTPPLRLVLREIDRYLARQESLVQTEEMGEQPSDELQRVRAVLQGKTIVLIGGDERPYMRRAIEDAFGLAKLIWVTTRPHEPLEVFVPYVKRDDVALVLLAIRWASHSYSEIADLCKRYGKPFVRLPGGYNPNQIALQIVAQAAVALGLEAPAAGLEPATL